MVNKTFFSTVLAFLFMAGARAQSGIEMADRMRSNGKIYVVVAVIGIIFLGITAYLISLDRRIGKLEKGESDRK